MIQYTIGTTSFTKEYNKETFLQMLEKQLKLSIPLITGVNIKRNEHYQKIYVGKEINFKEYTKEQYLRDKFEISSDDIVDIAVKGYDRACLLNYKKYDQVLVGINNDDIVVPDYYALKTTIQNIFE